MNVVLALYAAIAALFLMHTLKEGARKRLPWDRYRLLGVAMSLAWPVAVVIVGAMILRDVGGERRPK